MYYTTTVIPHTLHFKNPAGTSRGTYLTHNVWYVTVAPSGNENGRYGIGECAPLPALSCDDLPEYEAILQNACRELESTGQLDTEKLRPYPSILFGLESALLYLRAGKPALWNTPFSRGEAGIPINGLIWMGNYREMFVRIEEKIEAGFRCIKLKIGSIRFDEELDLLKRIRTRFTPADIELRVDANGAFSPADAMEKLCRLAELGLHSIEQPIRAGQWKKMARLTASTPLPIALDEELIGCNTPERKIRLLETIRPQYIILKPSLHGGIAGCTEWVEAAGKVNAGWWVTSALESNVGLNAIAQWCATLENPLPQGLGTGMLYTDNIPFPLSVKGDKLWFDPAGETDFSRVSAQSKITL
ncbi:MAG: o-succinylbenzoate synthase [Parabacteroides sp.]|nr:o-succinylbenzoate synthase [Parabacteroides sp.]